MKIIHLRNKAIDINRWDNCIEQSQNQLIYAFSWYLNVVSPNWEALVTENYEYVMPLPLKTRYKFPYLVQPVLTQQLGIFSKNKITETIVEDFIKEIPYFSYELNLNEHNFYGKALIYPNYVLQLDSSYENLYSNFSKNTQRNVDKALKQNLIIQNTLDPQTFISFYFSVEKKYLSPQQPILEKLIESGMAAKAIKIYGVYNAYQVLIAALCLIHTGNRLTYLVPVSSQYGKDVYAMFFLINHLILENCEKNRVIDFEGSQIEGVARLYKGFGAKYHPYYILKRFRPSFLIRK
jgi:hypothetical protein